MAVDSRSWAWCNLGRLAPDASTISESHLQGSGGGVIKTTGTINLHGVYRLQPGAEVLLAASDGQNWICKIPRKLRILDSFADPLRKITTVSVGCKFAYYENRKSPLAVNIIEEDANPNITSAERLVVTTAISAKYITERILTELGLTVASSIPFTNNRIATEWNLSDGYVQELAKIAESECYRCRLNELEQVEFINLSQGISSARLLTENQIIDLTPQTVGELPAEAVYATFQTTQLKPAKVDIPKRQEDEKKRNWERDENYSVQQYIHSGPNGIEQGYFMASKTTVTAYDAKDRVIKRTDTSNSITGTTIGITSYTYETGASTSPLIPDANGILPIPEEQNEEKDSVVLREEYVQTSPLADIAGSCGFEGSLSELRNLGTFTSQRRITEYDRDPASGITKTSVRNFVPFVSTPFGSDAIQKNAYDVPIENLIAIAGSLVEYGSDVSIRTERNFGLRRRPNQQERNRIADRREPAISESTGYVWATGSFASQTRLELSPPYVPDDTYQKTTQNGVVTFTYTYSGAHQKALNYARIENKLSLGNRSGIGLQLRLIDAPDRPFDLFYVRMNGCTAAYRSNGMTWTINPNGIVVSVDALFWGAIDGDINNAWFPLPPNITALPSANSITTNANPLPPNAIVMPNGFDPTNVNLTSLFASLPSNQSSVPSATLNPTVIISPYQETVPASAGIQVGAIIEQPAPILPAISLAAGIEVGAVFKREFTTSYLSAGIETGVINNITTGNAPVFLLQMTGSNGSTTFTDLGESSIPVTAYGNAQINGNELLVDGSGDYIQASSSNLILPQNAPWTVEGFLTPFDVPEYDVIGILSFFNDSASPYWTALRLGIIQGVWGFGTMGLIDSFTSVQVNTKVHFAIVHSVSGSVSLGMELFIAGTSITSPLTYFDSDSGRQANKLSIGRVLPGAGEPQDSDFNGKIGPFRISNQALYTSSFTPPTSFPDP